MKTAIVGITLIVIGLIHVYAIIFNLTGLVDFKEFLFALFGIVWVMTGFGILTANLR